MCRIFDGRNTVSENQPLSEYPYAERREVLSVDQALFPGNQSLQKGLVDSAAWCFVTVNQASTEEDRGLEAAQVVQLNGCCPVVQSLNDIGERALAIGTLTNPELRPMESGGGARCCSAV